MKTILYTLLSLLLISCGDDDNNNADPIDQLPPLTNTGENTFGCLIDGRAFTPQGGGLGGPSRGASYQFIYNDGDSYYNFQVFGTRFSDPTENITINLNLQNFNALQEGVIYPISVYEDGTAVGLYFDSNANRYETTHTHTGTLTITHYDYDNRIISGTFEFEVEVEGEIVKITDGRFDMDFTI